MQGIAAQVAPVESDRPGRAVPVGTCLEELVRLDSAGLGLLFCIARWQGPARVDGHPRGRMLAVPGFDRGIVGRALALFAASPLNVWKGKSFQALSESEGSGINRLRAGLRFNAFRFKTYETVSLTDGERVLAVDYDIPQNPAYARGVVDELRPVAPGLLLGQGLKRRPDGPPRLLVWFALDLGHPDPAVTW